MSKYCVINDAEGVLLNLINIANRLKDAELWKTLEELRTIIEEGEHEADLLTEEAESADSDAKEAEDELEKVKDKLSDAEDKVEELEAELESYREQGWREKLANDPDPYRKHGLHDGNNT